MTKHRSIFLWLIGLFVAAVLSSCDGNAPNKPNLLLEEETLAVVNSKKISYKQFDSRFQRFVKQYQEYLTSREEGLLGLKRSIIDKMVEEELIRQEAARKGIRVSKEELANQVESILSPYPEANFEALLTAEQISKSEWEDRLEFSLLMSKVIQKEVIDKIPVTKREIAAYYQQHARDLSQSRAFHIKHIVLATEGEAKMVRRELLKGVNLDQLIEERSISKDNADLGYVEQGMLPAEMDNAIFELSYYNRVSEVVAMPDGYHIFVHQRTRSSKRLALHEAQSQIREILAEQKEDEAYQKWLVKLMSRATITINENLLQRKGGF